MSEVSPMGPEDPGHIAVAEDDEAMRDLVCNSLRRAGYRVTALKTGAELGELIDRVLEGHVVDPIDLIVTDNRMPVTSGLELIAALRARDWALPVVLITAFASPEVRAEAARLGAAAVLDKPFPLSILQEVVDDLIPADRAKKEMS